MRTLINYTHKKWYKESTLVKKSLIIIALFLSFTTFAQSVGDYRSATTGNWATLATWQRYNGTSWLTPTSPQGYPGQYTGTGVVTIQSSHTVTLNASPAQPLGSLVVEGSYTTTNNTRTITISGNVTVVDGATMNLRRSRITVNGTTTINGSLTDDNNDGWAIFVGSFNIGNTGSFTTANTLALTFRGGIVNNGTLNKTGTGNVTFDTNNQTISGLNAATMNGTVTVTGITVTNNLPTLNLIRPNANALTGTGTWVQGINSILNTAAASINISTLDCATHSNTVVFDRNNTQTIPGVIFHNLIITNGSTKTLGADVTVNNDFTLSNGTTFNPAAYNFNVFGESEIAGIVNDNSITGTSTYENVNLSAGSMNGSATGVVNINGNLSVSTANGTIGRVDLTVNGTTNISASRTLTLNNINGVKTFVGTISNEGIWASTTINTAANLVFQNGFTNNSSTNAALGAATFSTNSQSLAGTGSFSFANPVVIDGAITLTNNSSHVDGITFNNTLNGTVAGSTYANAANRVTYFNCSVAASQPMQTGIIDASASGNTFHYNRNTTATIKSAIYHYLIISGGNTKTLGGNVTVNGDFSHLAGTFNPSSFDITVSGNTTMAAIFNDNNASGTSTFENVNLSAGNITGSATGVVNINGNLSVSTANGTIGRVDLTVNGVTNNSAGIILTLNNNTGIKIFAGAVTNEGTWTSTTITTAGNLVFQNGFTNNSSTNAALGAATFSTNSQSLAGTGSFTFANPVVIDGAITLTNNSTHASGVTFNNTVTGTEAASTLANGANRTINYQPNATTIPMATGTLDCSASGNTFNYNRNNAQTIKSGTYTNLGILNGNTKSLSGATIINGNLNIANTTTLDVTTSNHAISIGGNWINSGIFTARNGTVTFNGAASQGITSNAYNFYNVVFNNTASGSGALVLNDDVTISNQCTMTDGIIFTGSNRLILTSTTAANLTGFGSESYVNGNLRRYITNNTSTYALPVGNGSNYYRADIKNNNLNGITYLDASYNSLERHNDVDMDVNDGVELTYISIASNMWTIDPNAAPSSGSYDIYLYTGNISGLNDNEFAVVKRPTGSPDGTSWTTGGGTINTAGGDGRKVSDGYALRMGLTSFSEFGIGSTESGNPLPVQLVSFTAKLNRQGTVDLKWVTATEINNDFFSIERSVDGINFEEILQVKGAGNTSRTLTYTSVDGKPLSGISYYRLKQTDFDGAFEYFNIVSVNNSGITPAANRNWNVFPNPLQAGGLMTVSSEGENAKVRVAIFDTNSGKLITEKISETSTVAVELSNDLKPGIYIMNITEGEKTTSKRIIIQ